MKKWFVLFLLLALLVWLTGCSNIMNSSLYRNYMAEDAEKQKQQVLFCDKPGYGLDGISEMVCTRAGIIYRYRGDDHCWYMQFKGREETGKKSNDFWVEVERPILFSSENREEVVRNEQRVDLMQVKQPVHRQQQIYSTPKNQKSETPKIMGTGTQASTAKNQPLNSQKKATNSKKEASKEQYKNSSNKLQSSTTGVPVTAQERALMAQKKALVAQEEALQAKKQALSAHEKAVEAKIRAINAQERATKAQKQALEEQERIGLLCKQKQSNNPVQPKVSATTNSKAQQKTGNSSKKTSQQPVKLAQGSVQNNQLTAPIKKAKTQQKKENKPQKSKEQKLERQAQKPQKSQAVQK